MPHLWCHTAVSEATSARAQGDVNAVVLSDLGEHLATSGLTEGCHSWEGRLVASGESPGKQLSTPQSTSQPPQRKTVYLTPKGNSAAARKPA